MNQSSAGTDKVNAIINCHLATGRIGKPGMGPFSLTGQPNAMGGREVGGLANQLAAHMDFDEPADVDRVQPLLERARNRDPARPQGRRPVRRGADGRVKALWIMATNPAASMPRADRVARGAGSLPVRRRLRLLADRHDALRRCRTAGRRLGREGRHGDQFRAPISRQRAFRAPPGEARPDWWMLTEVARRMGWEAAFPYRRPADIFREHAALSGFENDGGARVSTSARWPGSATTNTTAGAGPVAAAAGRSKAAARLSRRAGRRPLP